MTSRNDVTRRLALVGSAAAGGLATAAFFLLRGPNAAGDDSSAPGDDSTGGGFTALPGLRRRAIGGPGLQSLRRFSNRSPRQVRLPRPYGRL